MAVHGQASQSVQILFQDCQEDRTGRGDRYTVTGQLIIIQGYADRAVALSCRKGRQYR